MICLSCRYAGSFTGLPEFDGSVTDRERARELHGECPEVARRAGHLTAVELKGSAWCDCQHVIPVRSAAAHPTLE
jgi:hypothetical protein